MAVGYDLGAFDPYHSSLIFAYYRIAYDSLLNQSPDGKFVSGLAQTWRADADTAEFTLRPDVSCSDGTPLTASQVAADLSYLGDPKNASPQYGLFVPKVPFKVTADDASRAIKISMSKPYGFVLNTLGLVPIMCGKGLRNPSMLKTSSDGTGPFVLSGVVTGQSYTFTVRKGYRWGPNGAATSAQGTPERLVLKVVSDETTAANLVLSGGLNYAWIRGHDRQRLIAQNVKRFSVTGFGANLWFNQIGARPTAEKPVRQALVHALDVSQLIKVSTGGSGRAATGLVHPLPKPCPGDSVAGRLPAHDLNAAAALLDRAGWTKGPDGRRGKDGKPLVVNLHYVSTSNPYNQPTAELLAQQWKAIGVDTRLTADTTTALTSVMYKTHNFDVLLSAPTFSRPDGLVLFLSGPIPPKGTNIGGTNNAEYTALTAKATGLTIPDSCSYWTRAEQALFRDADVAPLSDSVTQVFLHKAEAAWALDTPIPTSFKLLK
jgi:peptide/nickel transport system substrate-binding protein